MDGIWIDLKSKTTTFVEDGKATTQSDKNDTVTAALPMSLMEQLFLVGKGQADKIPEQPAGPSMTSGPANERTKIAIKDGQQVPIAWPSTQSVTELTRFTAPVNIALNSVVPADQPIGGRIFVKLAGSSSGAIQGAIAVGGRQVGDGNLDSAMLEMAVADKTGWNGDMYGVKPGDTLSVSVRIDGGDPTVLYQLSVPGK